MPELPEVETVRRELVTWLPGRRIVSAARVEAPAGPKYHALERAAGQRIEAVDRRGKFLLLPLSRGDELVIHLGMTGVIAQERPANHLRVMVELSGPKPRRLYFRDPRRFGRFLVVPRGDYRILPTLAAMGPEPLGRDFTLEDFATRLERQAPIKSLIMSQRPVAGVGNIYCDEALWRARIHPLTQARKLSRARVAALRQAIVDVLEASLAAQGTTFSDYRTVGGESGDYLSQLDAYGHAGEPCKRCGARLRRIVVGQRSSHYCPKCQRR
jgi:formamidopyrimidine-DNA glycosylase